MAPTVGQHGQTGHRPAEAIEDPVVVNHHALGEVGFSAALDLNVQVDPLLAPAHQSHFDELVHHSLSGVGFRHDFL